MPSGRGILRIDPVRLVFEGEEIFVFAHGLRAAQQWKALRLERVVKNRNDLFLQRRLEVDEHVAAAHPIHPRKGRVARHIVAGKDAHSGIGSQT